VLWVPIGWSEKGGVASHVLVRRQSAHERISGRFDAHPRVELCFERAERRGCGLRRPCVLAVGRSSLRLQLASASGATTAPASVQRAAEALVFVRSPTTLRLETPNVALTKASSSTKLAVLTSRTAATRVR
jgi:hypothetical protein